MISFNLKNTVCASLAPTPHLGMDQKSHAAGASLEFSSWDQLDVPSCCPRASLACWDETLQSLSSSEHRSPGAGLSQTSSTLRSSNLAVPVNANNNLELLDKAIV